MTNVLVCRLCQGQFGRIWTYWVSQGGEPGLREVKEIGSLISSDLIFTTHSFVWLEFTTHIHYLLEEMVHTTKMGASGLGGVGEGTPDSRRTLF